MTAVPPRTHSWEAAGAQHYFLPGEDGPDAARLADHRCLAAQHYDGPWPHSAAAPSAVFQATTCLTGNIRPGAPDGVSQQETNAAVRTDHGSAGSSVGLQEALLLQSGMRRKGKQANYFVIY